MHAKDRIKKGVTVEKLMLVQAWREAGELFDAQEQAALALAESVTNVAVAGVPNGNYDAAASIYSDKEMVDLTLAISLMNTYNRLSITFRNTPAAR